MSFKYGLLRGTHRAKRQAIYVQLLRQALPVTDCCLRERFRYISLQYSPFSPCISLSYSVRCSHLYPRPTQICGLRPSMKLILLTIQFVGSSCFRYTTCHMLHIVHEAFFESSPDFVTYWQNNMPRWHLTICRVFSIFSSSGTTHLMKKQKAITSPRDAVFGLCPVLSLIRLLGR